MAKKIFISADIEGTCGIAHWQETNTNNEYSEYFRKQMTNEVKAACEGALEAGFDEIFVKDAHDSARNLYPNLLPKEAKIMRGWTRNPYSMMAGLDETFDACAFTGYHSAASASGNPLSHTMNCSIYYIKINGVITSEFIINSLAAAYLGVPSVFLSGDKMLCEKAEEFAKGIKTVAVSEGIGNASVSIHPEIACERIKATVTEALEGDYKKVLMKLPEKFEVEVAYKEHHKAFHATYYPGAYAIDSTTTGFKASNYLDVLKFFMFVL